jgi:hypothetical protein
MSNPETIAVPLASTGLVARAVFELDLLFGNKKTTDAAETITYGTGGKFSHTVNSDGSIDFSAISTTVGDSDTATIADDEESITVTLNVASDTATGIEEEGVTYVPAQPPAAPTPAA